MKKPSLHFIPLILLTLLIRSLIAVPEAGAQAASAPQVTQFEKDFSDAVQANDVDSLKHLMSSDWRIISGDGNVITRDRFIQVITSGRLKHTGLSQQGPATIHVYGTFALVTARVHSAGSYEGVAFTTDEIGTDVLRKEKGRWICVLTQLTTVTEPK